MGRAGLRRPPGTVVRWKPSARADIEVNFAGVRHAHRCVRCGLRYTDQCAEPGADDACAPCRYGRERPVWDRGADPAACCRRRARLATPEERRLYRLAGRATWWTCAHCKRTHPYNPQEEK